MEIKRKDGRNFDQLREIKINKNFIKHALGSCFFEMGDTKVICTVNSEDKVPPFLKDTKTGWITAEYSMLPGSTIERTTRQSNLTGRSQEIQRMIGRSLRGVVDLKKIGERTLWVDCDVIQADGGTRTASITGSFIALVEALNKMRKMGLIAVPVLKDYIAAVSVGIIQGKEFLDLAYSEDSIASVDLNIVMTEKEKIIEIQATAEGMPFSKEELDSLLKLAKKGIKEIISIEKEILKSETESLFSK